MKWIVCQQVQNDVIRYITNDLEHVAYINYYKFIEMVYSLHIFDYEGFKNQLNKFIDLVIDCEKHIWYERVQEKEEVTFEELIQFHENNEINKESRISRFKKALSNISKIQTNIANNESTYNITKR